MFRDDPSAGMIDQMAKIFADAAELEYIDCPNYRFMMMMKKELERRGGRDLICYLGSVQIELNENFFEDEEKVYKMAYDMVTSILKIWVTINNDFAIKDRDPVMKDLMKGMSIKYTF